MIATTEPKRRLGDFVKIRTGKLDANANDPKGKYPFFTCAVETLRINNYSYDSECVLVAGNGDLNVKYYAGKFDAYQRTYIIESADKQTLDVRYLYHFMSRYVEQLRSMSIGGVIKYIKLGYLTEAKIPLPPLPEQKRIADILDKADAIRRKRQEADGHVRHLTFSIYDDMFGQPLCNPKNWPVKELSDVVAHGTTVSYGIVQCGDHVPDGVPYIRTSNMSSEKLPPLESFGRTHPDIAKKYRRSTVRTGDLVFANRATIGAAVVIPGYLDGANLTQGTTRISPGDSVTTEYLLWTIRTPQMQGWFDRWAKGVTFREITMGKLRQRLLQQEWSSNSDLAQRVQRPNGETQLILTRRREMKLNGFIWLPYSDDRDDYRNYIASAAIDESWGQNLRYMYDYIRDNFEIAYKQGKVKEHDEKKFCLFRAGTLVTREGEPITILGTKNPQAGKEPYVYKTIFTRDRFVVRVGDEEFPESAPAAPEYDPPAYHADFKLVFNFAHYLDDHEQRVEVRFPKLTPHQRFLCIYASLELAHKRGTQAAVSQWYCDRNADEGGYQWLLPLFITSENLSAKPDLIATLDPEKDYREYNVRTLLEPEYAYGHARAVSGRDPQFRSWA